MIQCSKLSKKYGSFTAVDNLELNIPKGSICGFLGMNGAGKTTSIRMLTGVIEPTSGCIKIAGFDMLNDSLNAKRQIGYIPDRPYLYPSMTSLEYLSFVASLYEMNDDLIEENSQKLLKHYSLWDKRDALIQGFSHGMKQRLATCAALVHEPSVLIVDEPMVGLDPIGAKTLKKSLRVYADSGLTILLSTHSLNVAEELCDYILIIHNGKVITEGSVDEIIKLAHTPGANLENVFLQLIDPDSKGVQI